MDKSLLNQVTKVGKNIILNVLIKDVICDKIYLESVLGVLYERIRT